MIYCETHQATGGDETCGKYDACASQVREMGECSIIDASVPIRPKTRTCKACGLTVDPFEPDPCLGYLPGVVDACCGHGGERNAYVAFYQPDGDMVMWSLRDGFVHKRKGDESR